MSECLPPEDSHYVVEVTTPITIVVLAYDMDEARSLALAGIANAREAITLIASIGQVSIGFPESITVKEVIKKPATEAV